MDPVTETFIVRDRPVGYAPGHWGGAFVAVERGYFPVSPTGYRSCTGFVGREDVSQAEKLEVLEKLADERDRERTDLMKRLRDASKPVGDSIVNYIQVSGAYEKAVQDGFFATDRQRAALWAGAYQLLSLVDSDRRFQPQPERTYLAWNAQHCAAALVRARELRTMLVQLAAGNMPATFPLRLIGASAYRDLPPKPGGEPKIDLGGFTAEMALDVPSAKPAVRRSAREPGERGLDSPRSDNQMGLFEPPPSVATAPAAGIRPSTTPGMSV